MVVMNSRRNNFFVIKIKPNGFYSGRLLFKLCLPAPFVTLHQNQRFILNFNGTFTSKKYVLIFESPTQSDIFVYSAVKHVSVKIGQ